MNSIATSPSVTLTPFTPFISAGVGRSFDAAIIAMPAGSIWSKSISMSVTAEPAAHGLLVLTSFPLTSTTERSFRPPSIFFIITTSPAASSALFAGASGLEVSGFGAGCTTVRIVFPPDLARRKTSGSSLLVVLSSGLGMLVLGNRVIGWLSPGTTITVSKNLILAVTAMFVVRAWAESQSIALNSASVFTPQVILFGGHALLNVVVAIALAKPFGVEGVAWSTSLTGVVTSVWGYPWMIRKYITHAKGPVPAREPERRGFEPVVAAPRES